MNKDKTRSEERIYDGFIVGWPLDANIPLPLERKALEEPLDISASPCIPRGSGGYRGVL
jgi:hypothetical protein